MVRGTLELWGSDTDVFLLCWLHDCMRVSKLKELHTKMGTSAVCKLHLNQLNYKNYYVWASSR